MSYIATIRITAAFRSAAIALLACASLAAFAQDADGDGVPATLELNGYRWNLLEEQFEPCTPIVDDPCYVTDPLSWSSDGDPYSDGQEASGVNMDNVVARPYNSPLVAAYPVIEVALASYSFTPSATITDSGGGEISQGSTFSYGVETTSSASVTVGTEASFPGGVSASAEATASFSETQSYSSTQTSGSSINWQSATTTQLDDAGTLSLSVTVGNTGGAAARNVRPRFNVYIGGDLIATLLPDEPDAIQTLDPGSQSPAFIPDGADAITLTFAQLKALQTGAPVTIEVVEIFAEIRRWTTATSNWGCGEIGDETCSWSNFQSQILPRTIRLLVDFGYSGDPEASVPPEFSDNPYEFRVYTGSPSSNPEFTLRDVLRIIEYDLEETGSGLLIEGRLYPAHWLLTAQVDENGHSPILQAWQDAGQPDGLLDVVMPTEATLLMASPDPDDPGPVIATAAFSRDLRSIRATAIPKGSIPVVSARAHFFQYEAERIVDLVPSPDGTYWTTEGTDADPFLAPAGAQSSYVVFTDRSGASRRSDEPLGLPILAVETCDEVPVADMLANPTGLTGFDATLFVGGNLDIPTEVFCEDVDGELEAHYWVPKATDAGINGLYGVTFVDPYTAVAVGNETILRSTDGGRTWTNVAVSGLVGTLWDVDRSADTGTLVAVGGDDVSEILRSTDDGQTWTFSTPSFGGTARAVAYAGNGRWYAADGDGLKISTDDGQTWADDPNAPSTTSSFVSIAFRDATTGLLLSSGAACYRTIDGGQTWHEVLSTDGPVDVTYAEDDTWYILDGESNIVLRSQDNGAPGSWESTTLPGASGVRSVDFATPDIGYVADQQGILRTDDGGTTWTFEGRPYGHEMLPRAVAAYDVNRSLAVGTWGGIRLTTSGGGSPVSVVANEPSGPIAAPTAFSLDPNYPNPFTGRTTLTYTLDAPDRVTLTIYDLLGREIARLVDEPQAPGRHTVPFEARDLASGTYLVRLHVGEQTTTRRMMHIR